MEAKTNEAGLIKDKVLFIVLKIINSQRSIPEEKIDELVKTELRIVLKINVQNPFIGYIKALEIEGLLEKNGNEYELTREGGERHRELMKKYHWS